MVVHTVWRRRRWWCWRCWCWRRFRRESSKVGGQTHRLYSDCDDEKKKKVPPIKKYVVAERGRMTGATRWCSYPLTWRGLLLGVSGLMTLVPAACGGGVVRLPPSIPTTTTTTYNNNNNPALADADVVGAEDVGVVGDGVEVDPESWSDYLNNLFDPVFDPSVTNNVTAVEGQTAHLVCRVNNLGTKTVSWIRHKDTHILTVGSFTYTSDHRFSALHREGTNEWTLQIRHPTVRDSGLYECQVSTKPIRAYLIRLAVVIPRATILHSPELHTEEGSGLNLTCVVAPSPAPPEYIFWYHAGEVINYESDKSVRVSVRQEGQRTVSTLLVTKATLDHSGRYQCAPSNTDRASITVHVFKAEEPAAMHTSTAAPPPSLLLSAPPAAALLLLLLCHALLHQHLLLSPRGAGVT